MTERKQFREQAEPGGGLKQKLKTKLAGLTLLSALLLGKPGVGVAQEVKTQDRKDYGKELVMKETSDSKAATDTISRYDATGGEGVGIEPEPDEQGGENGKFGSDKDKPEEKGGVAVHGMLYGGTGVAGDYAEVCSDRATLIAVVDMSHPQTGLGFTGIRLDDFHNDPAQPASRATVLNLHWNKKFGKLGVGVEGKYTFIDHLPQANGFSPDVVLSYTTDKGRSFEGMYSHKFKTGEDSDAFRLTIAKKVNDALKITGQGWFETGYDKHFYGRIIVDVNLGNGFGAQISCIAKYGKLVPTAGVIYQF